MNKIKFIMPVIGLAATAGAIVPAAVSCNPDSPETKPEITLNKDKLALAPNQTSDLTATLEPADAGELVWTIKQDKEKPIIEFEEPFKQDNVRIIKVKSDAKAGGQAVVGVSLKEKPEVHAECEVTVAEVVEPASVEIEGGHDIKLSLTKVGKEYEMKAIVRDAKGNPIESGFDLAWQLDETATSITIDAATGMLNISKAKDGDKVTVNVYVKGTELTDKTTVEIVA